MKKEHIIVVILLVAVVATAAFFGGVKYQQSKVTQGSQQANRTGQNGQRQGGGQGRNGFRPIVGDITAVDDKSITVKMQDGSTKIIILASSLTVTKTDSGSKDDLKTGTHVGIFGSDNSDGSVTAQNIQLNPMFRTGGPGGAQQGGNGPGTAR